LALPKSPADKQNTEITCLGFVNDAVKAFGRLDILMNNAGIRAYENVGAASGADLLAFRN
jgi:NAD(P)-dependent dehydrogenase (short-subunit alcohol dehydrogenase family)